MDYFTGEIGYSYRNHMIIFGECFHDKPRNHCLESVPSVPSVPSVLSVPSVPNVPSVPRHVLFAPIGDFVQQQMRARLRAERRTPRPGMLESCQFVLGMGTLSHCAQEILCCTKANFRQFVIFFSYFASSGIPPIFDALKRHRHYSGFNMCSPELHCLLR